MHAPHRPLLLVLPLALAACSAPEEAAAPPALGPSAPRGAVAPDAERLRADVEWLADDLREGRRAGSPGALESAEWAAARLAALGLQPAGEDGWFQVFGVELEPVDGGGSWIEVRGAEGASEREAAARHVRPLFRPAAPRALGKLDFRGYGLVSEEHEWNDYAEPLAGGPIVLLARGAPPVSEEAAADAPLAAGETVRESAGFGTGATLFHKVMTAKQKGAVAVLVAQHPDDAEHVRAFDPGRAPDVTIPTLSISAVLAERLWPGYAATVRAIDAGEPLPEPPEVATTLALSCDVVVPRAQARNVLALVPGRDRSRTAAVGAHFDHLGRGGAGSLAPDARGAIHNGADDNASGTAAVLEIGRLLAAGDPPPCDVLLALWSAEELGLLGSEHWARNPTVPLEDLLCYLNLDMVGRAGDGELQVLGAGTAEAFAGWLAEAGPAAGLELEVSASARGVGGSDHQTFARREVPVLHLFSGVHADYHRPSDDAERFEPEGTARVVALCVDLLERAGRARDLAWSAPAEEEAASGPGRFDVNVRFGTVPSYTWDGAGLLLEGTTPGTPAAAAGLRRGDVILQVGDVVIETIHDFMYCLRLYEPGDTVATRFLRDGEERVVLVELVAAQER